MCSKFVNEFYTCAEDYNRNNGLYGDLVKLADKYLARDGLIVLTDITTRSYDGHRRGLPEILSEEINVALSAPDIDLSCLQPLSCAFYYKRCSAPYKCFIQQIFTVNHNCLPTGYWCDPFLFFVSSLGT